VAGSTLYLPVSVKGALFSPGDAHAVQGDGKVNLTAIETAMDEAVLQFVERKDMKLERPTAKTDTHCMVMGFHEDLNVAVKIALRNAIQLLPLQDYHSYLRGRYLQQNKTPLPDGIRLQKCPLFLTQDPSALWTVQPKAFNLTAKDPLILQQI